MLSQILIFLLDTLLGLFSLALLLRFYMQLLRAPYRNPLSQFLVALTDFIVRPARRVIPGFSGIDLSDIVAGMACTIILLAGVHVLQGYDFSSTIGIAVAGSPAGADGNHQNVPLHHPGSGNHAGSTFLVQPPHPVSPDARQLHPAIPWDYP